jgi:glycogen operon protein
MILGGDEMGRTQGGNNNGYCQDNEISWFDWETADRGLLEFTRRVIQLKREHPVFQRRRWFKGRPLHGKDVADIAWLRPDGEQMAEEDWQTGFVKSLGMFLNGDALRDLDANGQRLRDDSFLFLLNAHHEPLSFTLPAASFGERWRVVLDTSSELGENSSELGAGEAIEVPGRALFVLSR